MENYLQIDDRRPETETILSEPMTSEWGKFRVRPYGRIDGNTMRLCQPIYTHTLQRMTCEMIHKFPKTFSTTPTDS